MPIKALLLDLAGVVYQSGTLLPGSSSAIERLRRANIPFRFVTNTTRSSKFQILQDLHGLGLEVADHELFTPVEAAISWLKQNGYCSHRLVHPNIADALNVNAGAEKAVVIGDAGDDFTYANLNEAFRLLMDGAPLLALANNRSFRDEQGALSLDVGAFVQALSYASGKQAVVVGKPARAFFDAALQSMGALPEESAMVGDDADADVAGALAAGLGSAFLVRTGKYCPGDEAKYSHTPTAVVADLAEAVERVFSSV